MLSDAPPPQREAQRRWRRTCRCRCPHTRSPHEVCHASALAQSEATLQPVGSAVCPSQSLVSPSFGEVAGYLGRGPRRATSAQLRVHETISCLAVGHSGYAQPPVSVLPALSAPPSQVPHNVVPCAQPIARPHRESELCHAAAPHAPGTKAAARPRWHRRRRPRARRAHFAARPVHVSGLAGFLVEVSERPRRGRVRRSQIDETISGLAVGHCGYAQPPASVVPALRAPPEPDAPHTILLFEGLRTPSRCSWQSTSNLLT